MIHEKTDTRNGKDGNRALKHETFIKTQLHIAHVPMNYSSRGECGKAKHWLEVLVISRQLCNTLTETHKLREKLQFSKQRQKKQSGSRNYFFNLNNKSKIKQCFGRQNSAKTLKLPLSVEQIRGIKSVTRLRLG